MHSFRNELLNKKLYLKYFCSEYSNSNRFKIYILFYERRISNKV